MMSASTVGIGNGYPIGLGSCVISFIETVLDYKVMQIESC